MAKHLYLPELKETASVRPPEQDGIWAAQDGNWLGALSEGIKAEAKPSGVSSIPDVYAQPILFWNALTQEGHPQHDDVVQEWRGLLSLLALDTVKKLGLDYQLVTFSERPDEDELSKALRELKPDDIYLEGVNRPAYRWTELILIRHEGVTLGALSPSTLVFTAADYFKPAADGRRRLKTSFPYKDKETGRLCPPRVAENQRDELESVGEWVTRWLRPNFKTLADKAGPANGLVNTLNRELDRWVRAIGDELGQPGSEDFNAEPHKPGDRAARLDDPELLDQRGIYKLLLTPLVPDLDAEQGRLSDYELVMSTTSATRLPEGVEHVVLIHTDLGRNGLLWRPVKFSDLGDGTLASLFPADHGSSINGHDISKDGGMWIRPDLYFLTPHLTRARGSGTVLAAAEAEANGGSARYLLPLRPEILHFFTVEEIKKLRPRYDDREADRVLFSLDLPVRGRTEPLTITKTYWTRNASAAVGAGTVVEREIPVLELFPNYLGEVWARYYMLFSDTERLAAQPISRGTVLHLARRERQVETPGGRLEAELTRISGADCFPEAVALTERATGAAIGLVLLSRDAAMTNAQFRAKAVVGVDFGTSNTNVFVSYDDDKQNLKPLELRFGSDHLRGVLTAAPGLREAYSQAFVVPVKDVRLPVPTALRKFNLEGRRELLLDDFPFFPDEPRYPDNVEVDIKWESEDTTNLNNYLEGLVFLLLIELVRRRVGHLEFRCTYPKAFSDIQTENYKTIWKHTLEGVFVTVAEPQAQLADGSKLLYTPGGVPLPLDTTVTLHRRNGDFSVECVPSFETEGKAAGEFFSNKDINPNPTDQATLNGAICIDVGGGTTDFSIWAGGEICLDASVRLAGREITEAVARNARLSGLLFSPDSGAALREVSGNRFGSRMNFILHREHADIPARLAQAVNNRDIKHLRRMLVIEFGALAFYAGHLVLAVDWFKKGTLGDYIRNNGISLHWGGNASKLLSWIDLGQFQTNGTATRFMNAMFASVLMGEVAPAADRIKLPSGLLHQRQSPGHKNEAAGGTVVGLGKKAYGNGSESTSLDDDYGSGIPGMQQEADTLGKKVIMAEKIRLTYGAETGTPFAPVAESLFKTDSTSSPLEETTLEQLDYFLKILNFNGERTGFMPPGEQLVLTPQERQAIRNNVKTEFDKMARKKPGDRAVESVFIIEVRELLGIMRAKNA